MQEWWVAQLDYVFCVYGLAFILLAVTCQGLSAYRDRSLPWHWLSLFGLLHGVNEWLDMLALSLGDSSAFRCIRLVLMAASFVSLVEFGRRSIRSQGQRVPGSWVLLAPLFLTGLGGLVGLNGLNATCRYAFGFPGGLLAGWALLRQAGRADAGQRRPLGVAGIALLVYAPASGLIVSWADLFPARWLNEGAFVAALGLPVQLGRSLCAVACALGLYLYCQRSHLHKGEKHKLVPWVIPVVVASLIASGGWIAHRQGRAAESLIRTDLLSQATAIAETISPEQVGALSFTPADKTNPQYQRLRDQLRAYQPLTHSRGIWSLSLRDGTLAFGPESYLESDPLASPVGTLYEKPPPQSREVFKTGNLCTVGPYADEYGVFVTAIAPIRDPRDGRVLMAVCVDMDATEWRIRIAQARLTPILLTLVLAVILAGGGVLVQWRVRWAAAGRPRLRYAESYIAGSFGVALTLMVTLAVQNVETGARKEAFHQLANAQVTHITQELRDFEWAHLGKVARFMAAHPKATRDEFREEVASVIRTHAIHSVGWAPRIAASDKESHQARIRNEGPDGYTVFQKDPDGQSRPASGRDDYYPILYVEPKEEHFKALGYDVGSEPQRRAAIEEAARSGMTVATDLVRTAVKQEPVIMTYVPVFASTPMLGDGHADHAGALQARGVVLGSLRPESLFASILSAASCDQRSIAVDMYQLTAGAASRWLVSSLPADNDRDRISTVDPACFGNTSDDLSVVYPVFAFGKAYALGVHPGPGFHSEHPVRAGWTSAIVGCLLTTVMTTLVTFLTHRQSILENLIQGRTRELRESERRFRDLFEKSPDPYLLLSDGVITDCNDATAAMLRGRREQILGQTPTTLSPELQPDGSRSADSVAARMREAKETSRARFEWVHRRLDGSEFWVEVAITALTLGEHHDLLASWREITDRKHAEDALCAQKETLEGERRNLQAILDASQVGMLLLDEKGRVARANQATAALTGKELTDIVDRQPGDGLCCLHASRTPRGCGHTDVCFACPLRNAFERVLRTGEELRGVETEFRLIVRGLERRLWVSLGAKPLQLDGASYVLVALSDITDRKRVEEGILQAKAELEATNAQLKAADATKSQFLANMSHEIRTPMTAILGYAELVAETIDCCERCPAHSGCSSRSENHTSMATIRRNGEHLLGLINDILELSRVETGKMTVDRIPCSLVTLVEETAALMQAQAAAKGLAFNTEYLGPIPEAIHSDPGRLRQILINLVGNAIKFTETGGVRVIVRLVTDAPAPMIQFDVVDTGIGMSPDQAGQLFRPFTQADGSMTRRFGGTGLGLTISRSLARLLGGDVSIIETQPNLGTRFRLMVATGPLEGVRMLEHSLSLATTSQQEQSHAPPRSLDTLRGVRVLFAEDGPDNLRLISQMLKRASIQVVTVDNGQAAVMAALNARAAGTPFDVVLMDMQMPVLDGYEATRTLRERGYTEAIIALTAHAMTNDRDKCLQAGCDDYASKPITQAALLEMIRRHLTSSVCPG